MPAPDALPAIRDLLGAFADAVLASKDNRADVRRGSVYDHFAGAGAMLLSREAQHDRDLFRALYFDTATGAGAAVRLSGDYVARVDDALWDASWIVDAIECTDGTVLEEAPALRARVRASQLEKRVGYVQAITNACVAQGAANVALFASSYGGDAADFGINA